MGYALADAVVGAWLEKLWRVCPATRRQSRRRPGGARRHRGRRSASWAGGWPARSTAVLRWLFPASTPASRRRPGLHGAVGVLLRVSVVVLVVYGGLLRLTYWTSWHTPKGFIPTQDMGYLMVDVQLPDAASAERTRAVTDHVQQICRDTPGVKHTVADGRLVVRHQRQRLELRLDVRDPRRFSTSDKRRNCRLRRSPPSCASDCAEEMPEAVITISAGAAGARRGPHRRVQGHGRRSRRPRPASPAAADRQPGGARADD